MYENEFIKEFISYYNYPETACSEILRIERRLDSDRAFAEEFDGIFKGYMFPKAGELKKALEYVSAIAEKYSENEFTLHFVFILNCMPVLRERYASSGYPDELFWNGADDLRCKLLECMECKGVPGTFVGGWFDGFIAMNRFALGRFQFEKKIYNFDFPFTTACGKVVTPGDTVINFHIPSSGVSLTDEIRFDSYKKAYEFYKPLFPDGKVVFSCGSWLLYPRHREFLPEKSNILKFMNDFEIVAWEEKEEFANGWRVFGKYASLPPEKLPRNTSLQRAFADWLLAGNKLGDAFGVIVFDGEKILK